MIKTRKLLISLIAPFLISVNVLAMDSDIDQYLKDLSSIEYLTEEESDKEALERLKEFNKFNKLINKGVTGSISFQKFMAKDEVDKRFEKEQKYDSKLKKIHIAAEIGAEEYLEELLKENPEDLEATDNKGLTPLMRSTMDLTCKSAKLLISKGANLNVRDNYNHCLHILAAALENEDMMTLLSENNAPTSLEYFKAAFEELNSDSKYEGTNIDELDKKIVMAMRLNCCEYFEKNWETIKDKVNNGIKGLQAEDNYKPEEKTMIIMPLISSTGQNEIAIVKTLISLGADVNVRGKYFGGTSLHAASEENNLEIVRLLLNANARVEITDFKGKTPLALAIELRKKLEENGDQEELKKNEAIINMLNKSYIDKSEQN